MSDVYQDLCTILEYPKSKYCRKMFETLCPDLDEARVLAATKVISTAPELAEATGLPLDEVRKHIHNLRYKACLGYKGDKDGEDMWVFGPYGTNKTVEEFTDGIAYAVAEHGFDWETHTFKDEQSKAIVDTCMEFLRYDWYQFQRVDELQRAHWFGLVGMKPTVSPGVYAMEKSGITRKDVPEKYWKTMFLKETAEEAEAIYQHTCPCRFREGVYEDKFPVRTCTLVCKPGDPPLRRLNAEKEKEMGLQFQVDAATAVSTWSEAERKGMIHAPGAGCTCEPETCNMLWPVREYGDPLRAFDPAPFRAVHDEKAPRDCEKCGLCVKKCYFGAISMVDGKTVVDHERCHGCGCCVAICPNEQYKLIFVDPEA